MPFSLYVTCNVNALTIQATIIGKFITCHMCYHALPNSIGVQLHGNYHLNASLLQVNVHFSLLTLPMTLFRPFILFLFHAI